MPQLACSPASGATFSIGTTAVVCRATDVSGNVATSSFTVHVRGAGEQLARLIDKTLVFLDLPALRPVVSGQLQSVADAWVAKRPWAACLALDRYIVIVQLAPTRALTAAERSELVTDARRIEAVIGCS